MPKKIYNKAIACSWHSSFFFISLSVQGSINIASKIHIFNTIYLRFYANIPHVAYFIREIILNHVKDESTLIRAWPLVEAGVYNLTIITYNYRSKIKSISQSSIVLKFLSKKWKSTFSDARVRLQLKNIRSIINEDSPFIKARN